MDGKHQQQKNTGRQLEELTGSANRLKGRGQQDTSTKLKNGVSGSRACIHVHSIMLLLTMVRKLHSIALMLNLPLLHTGQMVLHWKAKQGRREELTTEVGRTDQDRDCFSVKSNGRAEKNKTKHVEVTGDGRVDAPSFVLNGIEMEAWGVGGRDEKLNSKQTKGECLWCLVQKRARLTPLTVYLQC